MCRIKSIAQEIQNHLSRLLANGPSSAATRLITTVAWIRETFMSASCSKPAKYPNEAINLAVFNLHMGASKRQQSFML